MVALTVLDHMTRQLIMRRTDKLTSLRESVDTIDQNILLLLSERQALVGEIGKVKKRRGKKIEDKRRERQILNKQLSLAQSLGLDTTFAKELFSAIFHLAKSIQRKVR
jgi:chorismate mutase